jgi:hypothetical protein
MKRSAFLSALLLGFTVLSSSAEDAKVTVGDFTFTATAPWTTAQNTGMMTKAVLAYPVKDAAPLEAKFYHFGSGQGGDIEANVQRWIGQFEGTTDVKKEEVLQGNSKTVLVTITGTYLDGPPMGGTKTPRPDYQLLGAILVGKDSPVFIKLTGPKAATAAAADDYKKMALSPFAK